MPVHSPAHPLRLYKEEKLCSEIAIGQLFSRSDADVLSAVAFPLVARWKVNQSRRSVSCPRFLISVPKKRLRHAVDRVQMRRRIREAYRLNRHLIPAETPFDIAFTYVSDTLLPYDRVLKGMTRILTRINQSVSDENA